MFSNHPIHARLQKTHIFANKNESCDLEVPCSSQYCVLKLFLHTSFKKNIFCYFLGPGANFSSRASFIVGAF